MSADNERNTDDDAIDFLNLMQRSGVAPIKSNNTIRHSKKVIISPKNKASNEHVDNTLIDDPFSDECEIEPLLAGDSISYCTDGIQKNAFRKFRKGRLAIADELDLHGLNSQQARELLLDFLEHTFVTSNHCVRVIHGKGHRSTGNKAILKTKVNYWLKQHKRVLAFHSCIQADGGTGAVYVLLRTI